MVKVECVWEAKAVLGEGPVWDPSGGTLYFVDIKSSRLHAYTPATGEKTVHDLPEALCCFAPRAAGSGFVGAYQSRVAFLDHEGRMMREIARPESHLPSNRFNDGKAGPDGAFWFGSMDNNEKAPTGGLYRLAPDLSIERVANATVITNGPAFSLDGRTLYFTDTGQRTIYAFDLAKDGKISNRRIHITLSESDGFPDGMTVDSEGFLWVCTFFGWRVLRFDPGGKRDRDIKLPVSNITSCAFGGPDLDRLYLTTARWGLKEKRLAEQPLAGGLFVCEPGVTGLAAHRFAG